MKILEIIGFDKESMEAMKKDKMRTLAISILFLSLVIISDNIISLIAIFFMITLSLTLLYLSKKKLLKLK